MAEEKETGSKAESYMLQMRIPVELKEKLEEKAKDRGVSLNQYLMYIMIEKLEK